MESIANIWILLSLIGITIGAAGMFLFRRNTRLSPVTERKRKFHAFVACAAIAALLTAGCSQIPNQEPHESNTAQETVTAAAESGSGTTPQKNQVTDEISVPAEEEPSSSAALTVHFIDVGQGASQLLIGPTGKVMLIDAGDNYAEELMVAYLKEQGISKIDILIGTHPHADHIGGLDAVIDNFEIGKIYMPRYQANTRTFEDVLLAIQNKGLKINTAKAGVVLDWEDGVDARMVAPVKDYDDANNMSAVVHIAYGETSFLFTGDAEKESEADIVQSGEYIGADVLLAGHHGSSTSTTKAFLDKVNPSYAVIQSGKDNSYGHPHKEILQRFKERDVQVYRNDEQGHLVFRSDGKDITVSQNPWEYIPVQSEKSGPTRSEVKEMVVSAAIDNAAPAQNSTMTVTVTVNDQNGKPISGADVELLLRYKSTDTTYTAKTNADGIAVLPFKIGRAAKNFTVKGDITVTSGEVKGKSSVAFTPQ